MNDNLPTHDASRREQSRFAAGQVSIPLPITMMDEQQGERFPDLAKAAPTSALDVQVGGGHYKSLAIQPVEYIHANKLPFIEGCIVKYASRWRDKGGIKDLEKIKHFVDLLIELETRK